MSAHRCLIASFTVLAVSAFAAAPALKSPWSLHPVSAHPGSYRCPTLPPLPKDIQATSFYSDAKKSVIDPALYAAYNEAKARYENTMREVEAAADDYRQTGASEAAACVVTILAQEAANHAMTGAMSSNQADYVQNWTLGALAICWLKVQDAHAGTADQRKAIADWLETVADHTKAYFSERHARSTKDGTNNHYYWAGFAVMAAAVAIDDRSLYDWAKQTYREAASRVASDGTLPLEMDRGQRALHYHLFALAPIVMLAEFGEANGEDLYAEKDRAISRLVARAIDGAIDNTYFTQKAGVKQDSPGKKGLTSDEISWLIPYAARFPNPKFTGILSRVTIKPYRYLGGYPPGFQQ